MGCCGRGTSRLLAVDRHPLAILNELSVPEETTVDGQAALGDLIGGFVEVLRSARALRSDLALVSHESLGALSVMADGQTLAAFLNNSGGRLREQWRYIQTMRNHAPYARAPSLVLAQ